MSLTPEQLSALYSIVTKIVALGLIITITPTVFKQFNQRRLLRIKIAMAAMATATAICILPVIYFQYLHLLELDNSHLQILTTVANSTSLLTTAGAMYTIYKGKTDEL